MEIRPKSACLEFSLSDSVEVKLLYPSTPVLFRRNDGLPIKLAVSAAILVRCAHGISQQLLIKPSISWIIDGPAEQNGAFKIGDADYAEYHARDFGESAIYFPPSDKSEIQIRLLVRGVCTTTATMLVKLKRDGSMFRADVSVGQQPAKEQLQKCSMCDIHVLVEKQKAAIQNDGYLMTDENIKLRSTDDGRIWLQINGQKQLLKGLKPLASLSWECSIGKLTAKQGYDVVYRTPAEKDLSKSPAVITLFEDGRLLEQKKFWLLRKPSVMHC
ncbi:MAG: hypothetical protein DA330_04275, partial [Nitrososphaera sp.]|nr:hypothetical protein [Nitrososphaera sp.]